MLGGSCCMSSVPGEPVPLQLPCFGGRRRRAGLLRAPIWPEVANKAFSYSACVFSLLSWDAERVLIKKTASLRARFWDTNTARAAWKWRWIWTGVAREGFSEEMRLHFSFENQQNLDRQKRSLPGETNQAKAERWALTRTIMAQVEDWLSWHEESAQKVDCWSPWVWKLGHDLRPSPLPLPTLASFWFSAQFPT